MQSQTNPQTPIAIYQSADGSITTEVRLERVTLWLSLQQIANLFGRNKSVISRHLRNIFKDGELPLEATVAKNATVQNEGGREVTRQVEYFNLDAIISVGYRVNSVLDDYDHQRLQVVGTHTRALPKIAYAYDALV